MEQPSDLSTLQRKLDAAKAAGTDGRGISPAKALRTAVSKSAEATCKLAATVLSTKEERLALEPFVESLGEHDLMLLLGGPNEARAVACLEPQALAALIEAQTVGYVANSTAAPRAPTRIDSAMCEGFLNQTLQMFGDILELDGRSPWASGYCFDTQVVESRLLALLLEDVPYRVFRISIDFGSGAKQGELVLCLPETLPEPEFGTGRHAQRERWSSALESAVLDSPASMNAVLYRVQMSLTEATDLRPGDILEVPLSAIGAVRLEGGQGEAVVEGQLGQQNGMRALRLPLGAAKPGPPPLATAAVVQNTPPQMTEVAMPPPIDAEPAAVPTLDDLPELPEIPMALDL